MARRTADMFQEFERVRQRMEAAYQRVLGAPGNPRFCIPFVEPPVDVYQTEHEVVVLMEIAGIEDEEIELEVEGESLVIQGERKSIPGRPRRVYSQMEISQGPFRRELLLPADVDPTGVQASYNHGILEIVLPKASPTTNRQLKIIVR